AERRIAVSLQDERPAPGRPDELPLAENVRLDAVARAEDLERRVGDRQLLIRRGGEREAGVPFEDGGSRRQVEGDRAGPGGGDVRHGQRPGKAYGERPRACRTVRRRNRQGRGAGEGGYPAPTHPCIVRADPGRVK